jgi:hypothetical protein
MAGLSETRPHQRNHAGAGLRDHLGPAEDDHATVNRSEAIRQSSHDALADASDDRVLLVHPTQWTRLVLGNVQRDRYRYSIFCNWWLGTIVPFVPQGCAGSNAGGAIPIISS